jgi:hypothetical protein
MAPRVRGVPFALVDAEDFAACRAMTVVFAALLAVAIALTCWVLWRAGQLRREAESREARVLEALFLARQSAGGAASIDVDRIFGGTPAPDAPGSTDAVLRAAGLQAELIAHLAKARGGPAAAGPQPADPPARPTAPEGDGRAVDDVPAAATTPALTEVTAAPPETPAAVRDLVQVFYEARGYRSAPVAPSSLPIELLLEHKSDARRSYAFAPLAEGPTEAVLRSIIEQALRIGCRRVLVVSEGALAAEPGAPLPSQGVRLFDREAIEAQLAKIDATIAGKIRQAARRRTERRQQAGRPGRALST